jgi:lysozyme family protein
MRIAHWITKAIHTHTHIYNNTNTLGNGETLAQEGTLRHEKRGKKKKPEKILSQCLSVYHRIRTIQPGIRGSY